MKIKIEKLKELMQDRYNGNYNAFARDAKIDVALLYRIMNGQANAGMKTINSLIEYLKANSLKVKDYIFLP